MLIFPSWTVLLSWMAIVAASLYMAAALTGQAGLPHAPIVVGTMLGTLPSILLIRQAQFRVHGAGRAAAWNAIEDRLSASGYVLAGSEDGVRHYRPKLPRWLRWDEQDVRMVLDEGSVHVTGPQGLLKGLHRHLVRCD